MTYYTFRIMQNDPLCFEVSKWEDGKRPVGVYRVDLYKSYCNCVATKHECKHVKLCRSLNDPDFLKEIERWRWDDSDGWTEMNDIPTKEEFFAAVT